MLELGLGNDCLTPYRATHQTQIAEDSQPPESANRVGIDNVDQRLQCRNDDVIHADGRLLLNQSSQPNGCRFGDRAKSLRDQRFKQIATVSKMVCQRAWSHASLTRNRT
ncbi:Mycobacterium terramassiliense ORFan [Mycobacterium terramassiliense]|uniref:Mycobacterium terramassiliense ORFan n=1 Tax=Mycobacterium terramassiliense TaxID=1841859 RepID=A0A2U3NGK1_9MYCO|nr:Mycobacterium terramassiliense ORFan [Mycobacterium terramassiliense]